MGAEEHCKPYRHSLDKIPIRGLQTQAKTFNDGDHRDQGLKRCTRLQEPSPLQTCHKKVGDPQLINMEKMSKIMSQQETMVGGGGK